ncbi:MAG: hypothetical protein ACRERC_04365, partial [Candidatus Binatia bacterium]
MLREVDAARSKVAPAGAPALSVIIPLAQGRGVLASCLRDWTAQACDPSAFEIVAVAGPTDDVAVCRTLLRPGDRVVRAARG